MPAIFDVSDFLHPLDLAARQQLEGIPMLRSAVKKYMDVVTDRRQRQWFLSNAIRLSPRQLPKIYKLLPPICDAFGIEEPEFYLMRGEANAFTIGTKPGLLVIHHELIEDLDEDQIQAILAHECGHILAEHVLYRQMALSMIGAGTTVGRLNPVVGAAASLVSGSLESTMLNWYRKSELTADRASTAFMGSPEPMLHAMFHLLGMPKWMPGKVSYKDFLAQAAEFDQQVDASKWNAYIFRNIGKDSTHPMPVVRIRELSTWATTDLYADIVSAPEALEFRATIRCTFCGHQVTPDASYCRNCGSAVPQLKD